ncbi:MAG: ATP-dependent helicase HrpB [Pseudomonadota bacterium]
MTRFPLPVEECFDDLKRNLFERDEVILQAPPGAGKTTLVPLALLEESWLDGQKILMLEPRRIAAKTAALRMASLLNQPPGKTVGYRMRLETKVTRDTRIEIITEGVMTRMLQNDPSLAGVGLVIFDEFHERNLDSDLALALTLKGRSLFRGEGDKSLKILVMSATLDSESVASVLDDAPVVTSEGRMHPVEIIYGRARQANENVIDRVIATIKQALESDPHSSLLVFLPGQGEIRRVYETLTDWLSMKKIKGVHVRPLYGNLTMEAQQQAIAAMSGRQSDDRKVVLATNIAESSLTIEGVDVVIDSGLVRESRFNPSTGMSGLHTVKISSASSQQRAGRAGRLRPGKCYRIWSSEQQLQLASQSTAEIVQADLAPLAMQLLDWGVSDPSELKWLDLPPPGHWQQAIDLLGLLGAVEFKQGVPVLSEHGRAMTTLPIHPRLAHLLVRGFEINALRSATMLASLLSDRDFFDHPDISSRLDILAGEVPCPQQHRRWAERTRQLADQLGKQVKELSLSKPDRSYLIPVEQVPGLLLAYAYPDRIARKRHSGGFQLANGRSANLAHQHHLDKSRWLAVAEISGMSGGKGDIIRSAAKIDESLFETALADLVTDETIAEWDKKSNRFVAEEQSKVGALVLRKKRLTETPVEVKNAALIRYLRDEQLKPLPWRPEHQQWCARVNLMYSVDPDAGWFDMRPETLLAELDDWLGPYLDAVKKLQDLKKLDLGEILRSRLSWALQQRLNELAPPRLEVPSGSAISIDYAQSPPVLSVKLQEMFGCEQTPVIANGKVALLVHLLSPAGRPLQITQDLAGFWRTSYHDVKKEMKGRYPKHPWPDDPLVAIATRKTRGRV